MTRFYISNSRNNYKWQNNIMCVIQLLFHCIYLNESINTKLKCFYARFIPVLQKSYTLHKTWYFIQINDLIQLNHLTYFSPCVLQIFFLFSCHLFQPFTRISTRSTFLHSYVSIIHISWKFIIGFGSFANTYKCAFKLYVRVNRWKQRSIN